MRFFKSALGLLFFIVYLALGAYEYHDAYNPRYWMFADLGIQLMIMPAWILFAIPRKLFGYADSPPPKSMWTMLLIVSAIIFFLIGATIESVVRKLASR